MASGRWTRILQTFYRARTNTQSTRSVRLRETDASPYAFYARAHVHLSSSLTSAITCLQSIQSAAKYNITSVGCETERARQGRQSTPEEDTSLRCSHRWCQWPAQRGYHVPIHGRRASLDVNIRIARRTRGRFDMSCPRQDASTLVLVHSSVGDPRNRYAYRLDVHSTALMKYAGR